MRDGKQKQPAALPGPKQAFLHSRRKSVSPAARAVVTEPLLLVFHNALLSVLSIRTSELRERNAPGTKGGKISSGNRERERTMDGGNRERISGPPETKLDLSRSSRIRAMAAAPASAAEAGE